MLSDKPWKTDALVRLFASMLICVFFISAIATTFVQFYSEPQPHRSAWFLPATAGALILFLGALSLLHRSWPFEGFLRNFALLLLCVYGGFLLMWLAAGPPAQAGAPDPGSTMQIIIAVLSFQGASLVLVHGFLREHQIGWRQAFGLHHERNRAWLFGAAVGLSAVPIGWGLQMVSSQAMNWLHLQPREQEAVHVLRASATGLNRLVLGVTAILLAPIAEEILFRGILYPAIKQAGFPRLALWVTALLFGAIHANLGTFIPLTVFALALVWLYEQTDNLLAPITAHSLFNAVNFVMLFAVDWFQQLPIQK